MGLNGPLADDILLDKGWVVKKMKMTVPPGFKDDPLEDNMPHIDKNNGSMVILVPMVSQCPHGSMRPHGVIIAP